MRIWSLHPKYLDTKGLVAVWRETLLAQKVMKGDTQGYKHHPQLKRFKEQADPVGAIAAYLRTIHSEAVRRGYNFNFEKIEGRKFDDRILCTRGQLLYEWNHLKRKLRLRNAKKYHEIKDIERPKANPIFKIVAGSIEEWEVGA